MSKSNEHAFTHFGPGPYVFEKVTTNVSIPAPGVPGKPGGSCDHCSTGIMYEFWFHTANDVRFKVGCDCALKADPQSQRHAKQWRSNHVKEQRRARNEAKRKQRRARNEAKRKQRQEVWAAEGKAKAEALLLLDTELAEALEYDHRIIADIKAKIFQWGTISDKQRELVLKLASQVSKPAKVYNALPSDVEAKRVRIKGKVLALKYKPCQYRGEVLKMLVEFEHGHGLLCSKVWGSVPDEATTVYLEQQDEDIEAGRETRTIFEFMQGRVIAFDARVKVSGDDSTFGFFSRPTKFDAFAGE